jgi:tripartite-type tricarboxylate transporter receptor subunit TctC
MSIQFRRTRTVAAFGMSLVVLSTAALGNASAQTSAQDYPTRPVRWVVGFAAGGSTDI